MINIDTTSLDGLKSLLHIIVLHQGQLLLRAENCLIDLKQAILRAHELCHTTPQNTRLYKVD